MYQERRASLREPLAVKVLLADGSTAVTRNISVDGLFLLLPGVRGLAQQLSFEYELPQQRLKLIASGEVLRTQLTLGGIGVAIRLSAWRLVPVEGLQTSVEVCGG